MDAPSGNTLNSTLHEDVDSSDTSDGEIGFQDDDSYPSGASGMNYGHGSVHGPRRGGFTELLREKWQGKVYIPRPLRPLPLTLLLVYVYTCPEGISD